MIILLGLYPGGHATALVFSLVYLVWLFSLLVMLYPPPPLFFLKLYNPTKHLVDARLVCLLLLSSSVSRMRLRQLSDLKWSTAVLPQSHTDTLTHKHKGVGCVRTPAKTSGLDAFFRLRSGIMSRFFLSFSLFPHSSPQGSTLEKQQLKKHTQKNRATHKSARHPLISRLAV